MPEENRQEIKRKLKETEREINILEENIKELYKSLEEEKK